ncbi:hypothetical protein Tco_0570970 [Tanacetum coccineum]
MSMPKRSTSSLCRFVGSTSLIARLVFFSPLAGEVVHWPAEGTFLLAAPDAVYTIVENLFKFINLRGKARDSGSESLQFC